ncbi:imidazole glycerol phosphate synthase subunit HisH [Arenimonas composti]|uniref:Imidazole glycerol phosphate synthase subunit HisH n=1 Tax=Arenimonas composti TR7-09 = DSM 18010 TaxID=1121013 RepID=A0A091BDR2_9GAMM|nr:imidazole glycerol phosphate synthase subunit HisH [Arenimonas composti]KFN48929.1 hypothetical protein P873_01115 [Arenimonas composti TR7-09 = DSM 18010]
MNVAIVDTGAGNIGALQAALQRLGAEGRLVTEAAALADAERVLLPGVGAAGAAMATLRANGLTEALRRLEVPLLGICLGMQLLFERSREGEVETLGLLPGTVAPLPPAPALRLPHTGWSRLHRRGDDPLLEGVADGAWAYFVHGYAAPVGADCVAEAEHGERFAAAVRRGRIAGTQFHPERSGLAGARILQSFLKGWDR